MPDNKLIFAFVGSKHIVLIFKTYKTLSALMKKADYIGLYVGDFIFEINESTQS